MANLETFSKALLAAENVQSWVGTCKFQSGGVNAIVKDGALVTLGGLAPNKVYGNSALDYNTYIATAPAADTDKVVIIDLSGVSQGYISGNNYKIGAKLVGLQCNAGFPARYIVPQPHDRFWISGDCFNADPTVGQYAIPTAGTTYFTPSVSDVSATKFCVKIQDSRDFTVGAGLAGSGRTGKLYLCEVL